MFLMGNIIVILFATLFFFLLFTFVNVFSFCKHGLTSVLLTFKFLQLFFVMPFRGTAGVYNDRKKIMRKVKKDKNLNRSEKAIIEKVLNSKWELFKVLYKSGAFSYGSVMVRFARWYLNKPFHYDVEIRSSGKKANAYEKQYINNLELNLKEAVL